MFVYPFPQSLDEKQHYTLLHKQHFMVYGCIMLFFIETLWRILCVGAISCANFLDLFGPISGVTNPVM